MKPNTLSRQFLGATLWNTLLLPARLLVGLVSSAIYYGQRLSLDQVGVLFLLTSLAATIGLYADLGIERTLPRFLPEVERQTGRPGVQRLMTRVIRLKLVVLLVLVAGLALFARPLARALVDSERKEIASLEARQTESAGSSEAGAIEKQIVAKRAVVGEIETKGGLLLGAVALLLLLGALFDVYMQFLTAYLKQRAWNLITLASTLLQPLLVSAFILAGGGMAGVLLGLVLAPLVSVCLARWQVARASRELAPTGDAGAEDPSLQGRFVRFAAVNYLMLVTTWMYDLQFVVFLSAATLSLADVALLGFAYKFAKDFLGYVQTPLVGVMTPVLSRVHVRGEPKAFQEAYATLTRVLWLLILPAGVGLAILAPAIVAVLYPKYSQAVALILIFIVSTFGESLLSVPHNVLMVVERYRVIVASRLLALVSIPLVYLLLPRYGLLGVAVGVGLARIVTRLVTTVYGARELGLRSPLRFLGRVTLATAAMGLAVAAALRLWTFAPALQASKWERAVALVPLGAVAVGGAIVYALLLRLLGGLDEAEKRRLLDMRFPFQPLLARLL